MFDRFPAVALFITVGILVIHAAGAESQDYVEPQSLLSVHAVASADGVRPGSSVQIAVVAAIESGWHINSHTPRDEFLVPTTVEFDPVSGLGFGRVTYAPPTLEGFQFSEEEMEVYEETFVAAVSVSVSSDVEPGVTTLTGSIEYQACNDETCVAPEILTFSVPVKVVGLDVAVSPANQDIFAAVSLPGGPGTAGAAEEPEGRIGRILAERSPIFVFFFLFLGGILLCGTPCVFPMIPITVGFFSRQGCGKTSSVVFLAILYVLGIAITYSVLGVVAALAGVMFGAAMQNPVVLVLISLVMLVLASSMFGVFEITLPAKVSGIGGRGRAGAIGSFLMGLTAGIVAAPCIGPFVIGLLLFVGQQGSPVLGFFMFFSLALGLGFPFLLLAIFSGSLERVPRADQWMMWVRKFFGFLLIGMAIYFVSPLLPHVVLVISVCLLSLVAGVYVGFVDRSSPHSRGFAIIKKSVGVLIILLGVWFALPKPHEAELAGWQAYSALAVETAVAEGKPVMIDFSAKWCMPCKELDEHTFPDKRVSDLVQSGFVALKADLTRSASPEVQRVKELYDVRGVPTIVFLDRSGEELKELRVVGFVEPEKLLTRMTAVLGLGRGVDQSTP